MILNDIQIEALSNKNIIVPYEARLHSLNTLSYGQSSFGYDLRLSPEEFKLFRHEPGHVVDPKAFNTSCLEDAKLHTDSSGSYFIMPGLSYGLGISIETVNLPNNILGLCVGKSTYARCGLIANLTPIEPGWQGKIVLEFSNSSNADCKIYANEGVVQLILWEGEPCKTDYQTRQGGYLHQQSITYAKVKSV